MPGHTDVCPQTAGSPSNSGCPAGEEIVYAYGTSLSNVYSVECPDGSVQVFWDLCPGFGAWGQFPIALYDDQHFQNHQGTWWGDDGYRPPPPEEEEEVFEVVVADRRYQCQAWATGTMAAGTIMIGAGAVVGARAPHPAIGGDWRAYPVYDQSGYLYDNYYWNPNAPSEGATPAHIGDTIGALLVSGGAILAGAGGLLHFGCFLADG